MARGQRGRVTHQLARAPAPVDRCAPERGRLQAAPAAARPACTGDWHGRREPHMPRPPHAPARRSPSHPSAHQRPSAPECARVRSARWPRPSAHPHWGSTALGHARRRRRRRGHAETRPMPCDITGMDHRRCIPLAASVRGPPDCHAPLPPPGPARPSGPACHPSSKHAAAPPALKSLVPGRPVAQQTCARPASSSPGHRQRRALVGLRARFVIGPHPQCLPA